MKEKIVLKNLRKSNGVFIVPKFGEHPAFPMVAGTAYVPKEQWEAVRGTKEAQRYLKNKWIEEIVAREVKPTEADLAKVLTFDQFCGAISRDEKGTQYLPGSHFAVSLDIELIPEVAKESTQKAGLHYSVQASSTDYRLEAYGVYRKALGISTTTSIVGKDLTKIPAEAKKAIVDDCYDVKVLKEFSRLEDKTISSLAVARLTMLQKLTPEEIQEQDDGKEEIE